VPISTKRPLLRSLGSVLRRLGVGQSPNRVSQRREFVSFAFHRHWPGVAALYVGQDTGEREQVTIIELSWFVALPTSVAFCFVFPLRSAILLAVGFGCGSAVVSAFLLLAFACLFRLFRGRLPARSAFKPWNLLASILASAISVAECWHTHIALFGFAALAAVSIGTYGTGRRAVAGWWCLLGCVLTALLLHFVLGTPRTIQPLHAANPAITFLFHGVYLSAPGR
jgi:hypothetical protein